MKTQKNKKKPPKWSPAQLAVSLALRNIKNQNHIKVLCEQTRELTDDLHDFLDCV